MEAFPNDLELTAASALLLLSCEVFSSSPPSIPKMEEKEEPVEFASELCKKSDAEFSTDTAPSHSSLTANDSVQTHRFKVMDASATRCCEMKLKVARRARSKVIYKISGDRKPAPIIWNEPLAMKAKTATTNSATITTEGESSCLSSGGSSEISSAKSRRPEGRERKRRPPAAAMAREPKRREVGSSHIRRRAQGIMRLLSGGGCASEVRIRQVLGDSPDTSKALRMLLKMEEVKRTGAGGRSDPFIYTIAAKMNNTVRLKPQELIV